MADTEQPEQDLDWWVNELKAQLEAHSKVLIKDDEGEYYQVDSVSYDSDLDMVVVEVFLEGD